LPWILEATLMVEILKDDGLRILFISETKEGMSVLRDHSSIAFNQMIIITSILMSFYYKAALCNLSRMARPTPFSGIGSAIISSAPLSSNFLNEKNNLTAASGNFPDPGLRI